MMSMQEAFKKAGFKGSSSHPNQQKHSTVTSENNEKPKIIFRENGKLRRELLTIEAEQWADLLYDNKNGVTATQLRNFFNEVKALQSRIEASGFEKNEALIGLLKSKASYAYARAEKKRKKGFEYLKSMIGQCVDLSKTEEAFYDFVLFFEAVMGFFKGR